MSDQKNDTMVQLIKLLKEMNPETINGAVIMHMDEKTRKLKSISPMLQTDSIADMYNQLASCRDAIQAFLNDLVNKGLHKN